MQHKDIEFGITLSKSLGYVLTAQTKKGLCAVYLGDTAETVTHELHQSFPGAHFVQNNLNLRTTINRIFNYLDNPQIALNITFDIQGTVFQEKVWDRLLKIAVGHTATYAEIAKQIGYPRSYRAVANACANNPISIVVPCHRVIKKNGHLSGYRWGMHRKQILLHQERKSIEISYAPNLAA